MSAMRQLLRTGRGSLHLAACRLAAGTPTPALATLGSASHVVPPCLTLPVIAQVPTAVAFTHARGFAAKVAPQEVMIQIQSPLLPGEQAPLVQHVQICTFIQSAASASVSVQRG